MIPVYSVSQIRAADSASISRQHITSVELMERAAEACIPYLCRHLPPDKTAFAFILFCGKGNNGGDGLAIARLLHGAGYRAEVWLPDKAGDFSPDAAENYRKLTETGIRPKIFGKDGFPEDSVRNIWVDALVGTGMKGRLDPAVESMVSFMNRCRGKKFSIDIPSGLLADACTPSDFVTVKDSFCLSFQFPKQAFLFAENAGRPVDFALLDIGLDLAFMQENEAAGYLSEASDIAGAIPVRSKFSHKGNFGKILMIAGNEKMCGAAVLAGRAALRGGCGLLTIASCRANRDILQTAVPEAIFADSAELDWSALGSYSAVGIGPGLGTGETSSALLRNVLRHVTTPLLVDADGLNLLAQDRTLIEFLPAGKTVLTPHPKEFERLVGGWRDSWERLEKQRDFSNRYGVAVVLKGAHTSITLPSSSGKKIPVWYNSTGNPGMATGGSGDVLSGLLLALLGQGFSLFKAASAAVFLHGLAGDLAAAQRSEYGMTAGDLVEFLPRAFLETFSRTEETERQTCSIFAK